MNILFLTNHLNVGGITSYLLSLAMGLKKRGHNVFVASSCGDSVTRFTENGIIFIKIPIRTKSEINIFKIGISFFKLMRHIKERQIQLVHSNTRVTQVLGNLIKRKAKIPHVTTWHGFFKNRLSRRLFPCKADKIIAISESVKDHLVKDFLIDEKQISLVYNGIDLERLKLKYPRSREQVKRSLGLKEGQIISIIARLSDVKGHEFLIRAMKTIIQKNPDAKLLIVGEGKMENTLKDIVKTLDLEDNVVFRTKVTNIQEIYYITDIFVMPSLQEGLGLGLMEAMAWGKAVVGSEVGGIKNLITHGQNGLLVNPGNPGMLAEAITELLNDPVKCSILGNSARVSINEKFSLEEMVAKTEEVYRQCLAEAR